MIKPVSVSAQTENDIVAVAEKIKGCIQALKRQAPTS
jgi:hypothetical protein